MLPNTLDELKAAVYKLDGLLKENNKQGVMPYISVHINVLKELLDVHWMYEDLNK